MKQTLNPIHTITDKHRKLMNASVNANILDSVRIALIHTVDDPVWWNVAGIVKRTIWHKLDETEITSN